MMMTRDLLMVLSLLALMGSRAALGFVVHHNNLKHRRSTGLIYNPSRKQHFPSRVMMMLPGDTINLLGRTNNNNTSFDPSLIQSSQVKQQQQQVITAKTTTTGPLASSKLSWESNTQLVSSSAAVEEKTESKSAVTNDDDDGDELNIWAARGILLLVAMIWATNFPAVKYLETLCFHPPCHHPPSEFALARFGVAAIVSFPLLIRQRWDVIMAGFECGCFITLGYITQAVALSSISAGKCAFICSLTVVVVPILSALLEGKPIKPMNLVAAMMALCGVGLLEGLVDFNTLLGIPPAVADTTTNAITTNAAAAADLAVASSSTMEAASSSSMGTLATVARTLGVSKGDIIALGQPLGFGYTFMRIEHYVEKFKDVENRVLTISAAQCVAVGFLSLLWVLYDFHGTIPSMGYLIEPHRIATILWTGIVTTVFAIYLEGIALQKASATDAALTFSSEPVWASIFAVILLHETLNLNSYIGGAVILLACITGALSDVPTTADDGDNSNKVLEE